MNTIHSIILLLVLIILYLLQRNRRILKHLMELHNQENKQNNIFEKQDNYRSKKGMTSETVVLDKDIIVYDDWQKELQLVCFDKNAKNFPYLITVGKHPIELEEAQELYSKMLEHYNKGGRLFDLSESKN